MVLSKTTGAKDPDELVIQWADLPSDGVMVLQMARLSPRQPSKWTYTENGSLTGYNPVHGLSASTGALVEIETEAVHPNSYVTEQDIAVSTSYDWHIGAASEDYATGHRFVPSGVAEVPISDVPRIAVTNITIESSFDEFSTSLLNGIYYEDEPDKAYSGEDWEPTGRYDASSLPPASTEWSLFAKNRSCSSYLMKMILCENPNKMNYESQQSWSIPL